MEKFALDSLSQGILFLGVTEEDVKVEYANDAAKKLLGVQLSQYLSAFEDSSLFLQSAQTSCKGLKTFHLLFKIQNCFVTCKFSPYNNSRVLVTMTPKKDADEFPLSSLLEVLSKFSEIESNIIELHPEKQDYKVVFLSPQSFKRSGKSSKEYIGTYASEYSTVRTEIRSSIVEKLSKLKNIYDHTDMEFESTFAGIEKKVKIRATFILVEFTSDGYPLFLSCSSDVSTLKELERVLLEKQNKLEEADETYRIMRSFFDLSHFPMGTAEVSANWTDFKLVIMNDALKKDMDVKHTNGVDIHSKTAKEFVPREYIDLWLDYFAQCKKTKKPIMFEYSSPFTGRSYSNNVIQVNEKQFSWISVDITHINSMENDLNKLKNNLETLVLERTKELEEALQMKGRFLATMSHELRTPISGISGALQLISETCLTGEQLENVNVANVCTQQLLIVVNDILDLSKLEENKMHLEEIPCSLYETVEEAIQVVGSEAEKKALDIICDIKPSLPSQFIGDQVRLRQILVNLLSNAVKFSHKGTILVQVQISSSSLVDGKCEITFSVKDEGIGISEQAKEHLFQPFTQADSSTTRKYGGSGLGLSICKKLTEMMGGKIWFESNVGVGSTFHFTIVSKMIHREVAHHRMEEIKRTLVISNNSILLKTLQSTIPYLLSATTLEEGIKVIERREIKTILLDCKIGDVDVELTSKWATHCHVIVFGFSYQLARWEGKTDIFLLKKPLRSKSLLAAIHNIPTRTVIPKESLKSIPSNARILVAEDNKLNQHIIGRMLGNLGFERVKFADNGKLAVAEAIEREYDIVLMDIMMPEMGGVEATRILRRNKEIKQPVIIAVTADVLAENGMYSSNGFDDVMYKPIDKPKLGDMLRKYVGLAL